MAKLLQIVVMVNSGSVGRIAEQIGETVMSNGWESYIAYARKSNPSKSRLIRIGSYLDVYWHGLCNRIFDTQGYSSKRATRKLIRRIEEIDPDIIQMHHIHGYYINMKVLFDYLAKKNKPVVWIFHDCWSMTGHCCYFDFAGCDKWQTECSKCPQKGEYPASLLMDHSRKNYNRKKKLFNSVSRMTIVTVSAWLKGITEKSFLKKYPVEVIHNGIDIETFSPQATRDEVRAKYGIKPDDMLLLGVAGYWEKRKGLDDFLKLAKMLAPNTKILLIGLKKREIRSLPKGMIGIERTESVQKLAEIYTAADLFVNPTWEDTFPTTNLEAMACGTPVVTYRTGGSVEAITPETGFIVEQGDLAGLLEVISIVRKKGRQEYTDACRKRALETFDKRNCFKGYQLLYDRLLNS